MSQQPAEQTPAGHEDALARLDGIDDVPLSDRVEVFQAIHDELSARLSSAEN
ncbi:hypothetical protein [Georgenia alba]|uniref:Uncharacterized protein n=1 Tax=Georgenia alba TaxID=2233858 RepID=A0ABW2QBY3_9MICO